MRKLLLIITLITIAGAFISCEDNFADKIKVEEDAYIEESKARYPDIEVRVDSADFLVESGDTLPMGSGQHNVSDKVTFRIYNRGEKDLFFTGMLVRVSDSNNEFSVTSPAAQVIPDSTTTFDVTFAPDFLINTGGERNGIVTIYTNDPDEGTFTFTMNYDSVGAPRQDIQVKYFSTQAVINNDEKFNAGSTDLVSETVIMKNFQIYNAGTGDPLTLTGAQITMTPDVSTESDLFTFYSLPGTTVIQPSLSTNFSIQLDPAGVTAGAKSVTVTIYSDDYYKPEYSFTIAANVYATTVPDINIRQEKTQLPSGTGVYYFEPVLADGNNGYTSPVIPFTIENLGTATLSVTSVAESSGNTTDFDTGTLTTTIAAPDYVSDTYYSDQFNITFDPITAGWKSMVVTVNNDDPDVGESSYTFTVKGGGILKQEHPDALGKGRFGNSVDFSSDGKLVIIGAPGDGEGGRAYIYTWNGTTLIPFQTLTSPDPHTGDRFGYSVAIDGDYAIVGAPGFDKNGRDSGVVFFYFNDSGTWKNIDGAGGDDEYDQMGYSVDLKLSNELGYAIAVAGAPGDDYIYGKTTLSYAGTVRLYTCEGGKFSTFTGGYTSVLNHLNFEATDKDLFGSSVAIDDTNDKDNAVYVVVGAVGVDTAKTEDSGAAYVFNILEEKLQYKLNPERPFAGTNFGLSVDIHDGHILVGASGYVTHFFLDGEWRLIKTLFAPDKEFDKAVADRFGSSVSLFGTMGKRTAVIGSPLDDNKKTDFGSIYYFRGLDEVGWEFDRKLLPPDDTLYFGSDVSYDMNSLTTIVGAYGDIDTTGAVYMIPY